MNGEDNPAGSNDFDLYVYEGRSDGARLACAENGSGQFGFCEVAYPASGAWTVEVRRKRGAGTCRSQY